MSRVVAITIIVITNPYRSPVYVYAIASIIGAYTPYVLLPSIYLPILTIVANMHIAISNCKICSDIPLFSIQFVKGEYSIKVCMTI